MVQPDDPFIQRECNIELGKDDDPFTGQIKLTEEGLLSVQFDKGVVPHTELHETWNSLRGRDIQGNSITVSQAHVGQMHNLSLTEINTPTVTISNNEDIAPGEDKEVVIDFDLICFQPTIPPSNQVDYESRKVIKQIEDEETAQLLTKQQEFQYVQDSEIEIFGVPLVDTKERVEVVKKQARKMRTGKIRVKQHQHGSISYHVDVAKEEVQKIIEISQLVQETTPRFIRVNVVRVDGSPVDELDIHYEELTSGTTANVGGRFSQFPDKVLWANFPQYVQKAYKNYTPRLRDELHLRLVLGYYVDARDSDRPVQGKLLSTCSAIELFALWHAREDGVSEKTGPKIQHVVRKLDVETSDLASQIVPDPTVLDHPEYFWIRERNHVVHGDPDASIQELIDAHEAALVLLKRLLRNQLLGPNDDTFGKFYSIGTRPSISFDD